MASSAVRSQLCAFYQLERPFNGTNSISNISVHVRKMSKLLDIDTPIISLCETRRFITECLVAAGASQENAEIVGDNLATADYRGHYSHGMNRLGLYINDIVAGVCDGKATPEILKETPVTAWMDGKNGLGAVIGKCAMDLAIRKAKTNGIGWVAVKGSNHFGIAGIFTEQAGKEGLLGMSFTNTSALMCPTRAKKSALGTNPLSLHAPGKDGDSFFLDMATTAVAVGKIEIQQRKKQPIPEGWALNEEGKVELNADVAYKAKRLMPLGGSEANSGYKGTGLGMLVEIFSGILSGSSYGPNIRSWGDTSEVANLGHCFVALDPNNFAPDFETRMSDLMNHIRGMEPADPNKPVLVAGDPEREHMKCADAAGGVRYVEQQLQQCKELAKKLKVKPLQPASK